MSHRSHESLGSHNPQKDRLQSPLRLPHSAFPLSFALRLREGATTLPVTCVSFWTHPIPLPCVHTAMSIQAESNSPGPSPQNPVALPRPRPTIQKLSAYVPGEQPKIPGLIKLNTNENPYPPAPEVIEAARNAVDDRMRIYPDPVSLELRQEIADRNGLSIDQVIMGNGSDEVLRMVCMAYLDPGDEAAMLWPTYSLYDTFIEMFAGRPRHIPAEAGGALPALNGPAPRVFFLANPNPPFGTLFENDAIEALARSMADTLVVLDEAYIDFADSTGLPLLSRCPNLLITRTFSKSYSLAGMRLGWGMGHPGIIATLAKVKDSYNLDRAQQAVGLAALRAEAAWKRSIAAVRSERDRVTAGLRRLGFDVPNSAGNFVFPRNGPVPAEPLFRALRESRIVVRYFSAPELKNGIRVSIGTPDQMNRFLEVVKDILG